MKPVLLPVLGANMSHATVVRWFKQEGEIVRAGEPLFEVETDKANVDVEAEVDGVVRRIVAPAGARVPVLDIVAFIGGADEPVPPADQWAALRPPPPEDLAREPQFARQRSVETVSPADRTGRILAASPAARRLARERGVDLSRIRGSGVRGEIVRADVEAALRGRPVSGSDGRLDPTFVEALRRDPEAFGRLSSETKVELYRAHGARIGEGVRIERGAVIIAEEILLGAQARIGENSRVDCGRFQIGRLSAFGRRTRVQCREVRIGDALWSKDDVVIGGGGRAEPGARLRAGDACFFGEGAYLNPGHPLELGDEVCVGSRAMLFTHSHWQSVLDGYSAVFGPIRVEDHAFIGNNAFVFPGVTIGRGATVMVGSLVSVNVPERSMVAGIPAQVVRRIRPLSRDEQLAVARGLLPELARTLERNGWPAEGKEKDGVVVLSGPEAELLFARAPEEVPPVGLRRRVVLTFAGGAELPDDGATWFDLGDRRVSGPQDEFSDEVREFLRRRGVRFRPFAWRYRIGHFEGERFVPRRIRREE